MDFVQGLDPSKLVLAGTALSFFLSLFVSPAYNFPLFLFGIYAQENNTEASQSLQTFTGLLGVSALFDIVWMLKSEQNGWAKFLTFCLLILKIPTFFAFLSTTRQRGGQFGNLGPNLGGPTVWSMPGGFTSGGRDGYQTVEDDNFIRSARPAANNIVSSQGVPPAATGAYQTV
ncbi:hypothetical protein K443DRAFT_88328 [Laccaria amethystina LaAM-08-1]|uniref:Uncharacterized protein n=1 Tax=Laccaria amethystina LaAM-08-1 TaxID=1095629 RepID=A0A0C9Y9W6_9AGAR|nr:hypothetical protein K443DRAFT_88328 [Laccaria amethystina LaAM-08-1]